MFFSPKTKPDELKWKLIGIGGKLLIDLLFAFSRVTVTGKDAVSAIMQSRRCIYAFWHSRILLICYMHKKHSGSIMVSNSADGEIIAQILQRQGHYPVRGSTKKGGMRAVIQLISDMRRHQRPAVVVPDGPQGPRQKVQPGIVMLAQKTGFPIIPMTYSAKRRIVFNSWDRFIFPWPFTPCILIFGNPITIPQTGDAERFQRCMIALENELNRITIAADKHYNHATDL
jgi:lysophospholipid acyltransferase (LPLAT)-like uncharacterized protein